MNINPVSFGKTVKIYAPKHIAVKIANSVNGTPLFSPKEQSRLQSIFDDTDKGHAIAFYFHDNDESGYIFSGKESKRYQHELYQKALLIRQIKRDYPIKQALSKVLQAKNDFHKSIAKLISETKEKFALKLNTND